MIDIRLNKLEMDSGYTPNNPYDVANKKYVDDTMASPIPAGVIVAYGGPIAPANWLLCDGSAVDRTTFAVLFAAIGTTHGSGDGVTTFNLPDYRGRFLRGVDGTAGLDPDRASRSAMRSGGNTGNAVGSVQGDQLSAHSHTVGVGGGDSTTMVAGGGGRLAGFLADGYNNSSAVKSTAAMGGSENRPKNAYVNFIIKA